MGFTGILSVPGIWHWTAKQSCLCVWWRLNRILYIYMAIWEAATAVHKQRNLMRRSITTFEERPHTRERNRQRASVHGCLGGGNPSDIYLWWILWISICRMRRSSFACGAFCLRRELPEPGTRNFACGA